MSEPPKESTEPNVESPQEISSLATSESESSKNDCVQRDVPSEETPPLESAKPEDDAKHESGAHPVSKMSSKASVAVEILTNSFAAPNGHPAGNYHPSFPTNRFAAPDVSLITQPLINTPGGVQLSTLLNNERHSDYRHGFTPRPATQPGLLPTQSSVITNRTYSNTPRPFAPPVMLPMQRSTSTGHSYSSSSVFGNPSSQDRMMNFNFGFTPMMPIPPSSHPQNQQMPTPSPIFPLSTQQMAVLGYSHLPAGAATPLQPFVHNKKSTEVEAKANKRESKKKKAQKPKAAKPVARSRPLPVDVSAVMTLDVSTRACRCPKNQCIKLYCECFHRGQICDPSECNCKKCLNTAEESSPTGARTKRVKELLSRKGPDAFKVKPKKTGVGCSCKKSRCLKKYCDCVTLGRFCDPEQCICKNCQNLDGTMSSKPVTKENVPPAVKENVAPAVNLAPTHDVKVFIDVTNGHVNATEV